MQIKEFDWLSGHGIWAIIIQQILTLSKYGHDSLGICYP